MQSGSGHPSAMRQSFSMVSRTLKQMPGRPSVVAVNAGGSIGGSTGENQVKVWFEACQKNGCLNNKAMLVKDIITYAGHKLIPKLKFNMNNNQLKYSTDPKTLCALSCRDMRMLDPNTAVTWWESYKGMIADVMNAKHADVTGALKKAFVHE
jgi:hypothetical protein